MCLDDQKQWPFQNVLYKDFLYDDYGGLCEVDSFP